MMATVAATCCCAAIAATALLLVTCKVPAMYMATQTVPFVSRHTTDIVMDSGDGVPIYGGYTLRHAILRLAGRDLSEYAMIAASAEREIARDVKENPSYIGVDYDTELKSIAKFDKKKTSKTETSSLSALDVSIALIYCTSQVSLTKRPTKSTTLLSRTSCIVTLTPAKICTTMSCSQVARPFSKGLSSA